MKKKRIIPLLTASTALLLAGCTTRQEPVQYSEIMYADAPSDEPASKTVGHTKPEPVEEKRKGAATSPEFCITTDPPSLTERLLSRVDQEKLKKYEGSYTISELRADEDPAYTVPLYSAWLPERLGLPQTRLRVKYKPETGSYELIGGDLQLPAEAWSLSYEKDSLSEENQTYLIWKKEF